MELHRSGRFDGNPSGCFLPCPRRLTPYWSVRELEGRKGVSGDRRARIQCVGRA
jgi:hypothetical protein